MNTADTYVRARIDSETKQKAVTSLDAMGLTVSDAIRILLKRIADEGKFPFELRVPNKVTLEAMNEPVANMATFDTTEELMEWLNEEDQGNKTV